MTTGYQITTEDGGILTTEDGVILVTEDWTAGTAVMGGACCAVLNRMSDYWGHQSINDGVTRL